MNQEKENFHLTNWELVAVNPSNKNWNWFDIFCLWGNNIQSVIGFSLITSLYLIYNLNSFVVFFGTLFGVILVYLFSNWIGKPSQKHGLPFPVILSKISLSVRIPNSMSSLVIRRQFCSFFWRRFRAL